MGAAVICREKSFTSTSIWSLETQCRRQYFYPLSRLTYVGDFWSVCVDCHYSEAPFFSYLADFSYLHEETSRKRRNISMTKFRSSSYFAYFLPFSSSFKISDWGLC